MLVLFLKVATRERPLMLKHDWHEDQHPRRKDGTFKPKTSMDLDGSSEIQTFADARAWWIKNLGGKKLALNVHLGRKGDDWTKVVPVQVDFPLHETHAFTDKAGPGESPDTYDDPKRNLRPRKFNAERARNMDRIIRTIEFPWNKGVHFGADLLFEKIESGRHHVVALTWSDARQVYVFDSFYSMTSQKVRDVIRQSDRRKNKGPLQKSEPFGSGPSVLRDPVKGSGNLPTGSKPVAVKPIGFCRCCTDSLIDCLKKSSPIPLFFRVARD